MSSIDFKLRVATKHPFALFRWLLHLNTQLPHEIIRDEGIKHLLGFLECKASIGFLREKINEVQKIVEGSLRRWPKADPSNMRLIKGPLLYVMVRAIKPRIVLETGVASGISTLFILQGLNENSFGTLYSIDLPNIEEDSAIPGGRGPGWIVPNHLRN